MENKKVSVIVIGAGYAGLLAAVRMAMKTRRQRVQITLINPSEFFVERPRLHQFAANQRIKQRPINAVLKGTRVQFIRADVQAINLRRREIIAHTATGIQSLAYDYLLYTAGSTIELKNAPGAAEYAFTLTPAGAHSAVALKSILPELDRKGGHVVIVGGGPTGIEASAELAESYPGLHVTLVTEGDLAQPFGGKIQAHIRKALIGLNVSINDHQTVIRLDQNRLITSNGEEISFDACLWAGGFIASPLAKEAGMIVNDHNQVLTDRFMRSISDPHVYAAGDSAQPVSSSGIPVRMAAYTAAITGAHAADCLVNAINGKRQIPLNFAYLGQGIALGRHDAIDFNNYPDDKPKNPVITGLVGVLGREFFVNLLADLPLIERHLPGLHFWPTSRRAKPGQELPREDRLVSPMDRKSD